MNRRRAALMLTLVLGLPHSAARAQLPVDASIRPLIPNVIALQSPSTTVNFDINTQNYPPRAFPVRYQSAAQAFGVFSNAATPWTVQMAVFPRPDERGRTLPLNQLLFRINEGPWLTVTGTPQVVLSRTAPTAGWLPLNVEFALNLNGSETGGAFGFDVSFTAAVLP